MLKAVLFDLDGTLLDIDLREFLDDYFNALAPAIADLSPSITSRQAISAVVESTNSMCAPHAGSTNREVFHARFLHLSGIDLDSPVAARALDEFYSLSFPLLKKGHAPAPGAADAVLAARRAGLLTALATNPIFPRVAIDERMRWADLEQGWFDLVTSYEVMHACKPDQRYYEQTAALLGVDPSECVMIGDDPRLDVPAADAGMKTFLVGTAGRHGADWAGQLSDLPPLIDSLLA